MNAPDRDPLELTGIHDRLFVDDNIAGIGLGPGHPRCDRSAVGFQDDSTGIKGKVSDPLTQCDLNANFLLTHHQHTHRPPAAPYPIPPTLLASQPVHARASSRHHGTP